MAEGTFEGRAAIVTGAGVGIGFEIARRRAEAGAAVLLDDTALTPIDESERRNHV